MISLSSRLFGWLGLVGGNGVFESQGGQRIRDLVGVAVHGQGAVVLVGFTIPSPEAMNAGARFLLKPGYR
jgi:hypothetical protein